MLIIKPIAMKKLALLISILVLTGICTCCSDPARNDNPTVFLAFTYMNETRSTGEVVAKPIKSWIMLFIVPAGVTPKATQSVFDLGEGYFVDTQNKSHDRTYFLFDEGGGTSSEVEPGKYFVYVVAYDNGGKCTYKTVDIKEHDACSLSKTFQSEYPHYSFESW